MAFLKGIWKANPSKHQKLSEELALQQTKDEDNRSETISENDLVTFKLKYLGSYTLNECLSENKPQEAVKNVLKSLKSQKRKPETVDLTISPKGIVVHDSKGDEILTISIYKISNCCTDRLNPRIFSFSATTNSNKNELKHEEDRVECYVFCCGKRKLTENVALSIAKAFTNAFEEWRILPTTKQFQNAMESNYKNEVNDKNKVEQFEEEQLIRFEDEDLFFEDIRSARKDKIQREWVCFEDESAFKRY
ncbi:low density lipoprotein receptor adapter protein 1-A-like [Onthophagus taurus]|uniref:low density lipoprotein receptor adapter protein 1-A-like n=1 Tax=Onthophagus taurus TaxID=166361 RepID=UPI0039BDB4D7